MKNLILVLVVTLSLFSCSNESAIPSKNIITSDIDNFWIAYDKIITAKDTVEQKQYLKNLFLDKGTPITYTKFRLKY